MARLGALLGMSGDDRQFLLTTLILLNGIRLGLWLFPFQSLLGMITNQSVRQSNQQMSIAKIIWAVNGISRHFAPESKCLARALTTQVLLAWQGYAGDLRIGVAKGEDGKLEAHAWVEFRGQVVMGYLSDLARYTPLPAFQSVSSITES